jgi:hypothetical protein
MPPFEPAALVLPCPHAVESNFVARLRLILSPKSGYLPIGVLALVAIILATGLVLQLRSGKQAQEAAPEVVVPDVIIPTPEPVEPDPLPVPSVFIAPGEPAQVIIDSNPPGTVFQFQAGVHYLTSVIPRDGDVFLGEPVTVISGARLLETFDTEGGLWYAGGQTQQGERAGNCRDEYPTCDLPEDLFMDDVILRRVASRAQVVPGTWYFDYATDRAYFADDPTGRRVEISVLPFAFSSTASNVTIHGLIIEKYASASQLGAIHAHNRREPGPGGSNWLITFNEVRWNHSAGVFIGTASTVRNNYIHHNGQVGIKGGGDASLIEWNTITFNNHAGFDWGWEAGGAKFVNTTNLVVRENDVAYNFGRGLWTDIDNVNTTYEGNRVFGNYANGIFHEISYDAVIRWNTLWDNGAGFDVWMWGGQILISNSSGVEVYENIVITGTTGGDGITLVQQRRGAGQYGTYVTRNNYIHNNEIYYVGQTGQTGGAADFDHDTMYNGNNRFDYNRYYVSDAALNLWEWRGALNWEGFRRAGHEANGQVIEPS